MLEEIIKKRDKIQKILLSANSKGFLKELNSEEMFQVVMAFADDKDIRGILVENAKDILDRCSVDFDMYNYFTILALKFNHINKEKCQARLDDTINRVFSSDSKLFLMKQYQNMKKNGVVKKELVFNKILEDLKQKSPDLSSSILFDLYIFPDFQLFFNEKHRIISTLIEAYRFYDPDVVGSQLFKGSTIIGRLLEGDNEEVVGDYLREMLEEKQISPINVRMIGGGGSSLVYKIKSQVIKLGETRNDRKIYINHRILASLKRNLVKNSNGEDQFYVETMKYVRTGDVTKEERDELKRDLADQGLIWSDDKLENCGLLDDDDENICPLPVDYVEVAAKIDNPYRREAFMKRKRKVVVIDNDCIRYNPLKSSK